MKQERHGVVSGLIDESKVAWRADLRVRRESNPPWNLQQRAAVTRPYPFVAMLHGDSNLGHRMMCIFTIQDYEMR